MYQIQKTGRRPTVAAVLQCAVAATAIACLTAGLVAGQQLQKLLSGLDPNKNVSLVTNGVEKALGTTTATGDLDLAADLVTAMDPNKHIYMVYKRNCSKYEIVLKDSDDEKKCKEDQQKNPQSPNGCGGCIPVGMISGGRFTASASQAEGGSHTGRNVMFIGLAGGAAAAVIKTTTGKGTSNPATSSNASPAATTFTLSSTNVRVTGTVAQSGCPLIGAYTGTGTVTLASSASGTFTVADPGGANRVYLISGTFAPVQARDLQGPHAVSLTFSSAPFNWTSGTGRNYSSQLSNGTLGTNGAGTAVEVHTYLSGGSAGPAPNCADRINLSFTP